MTAKRIPCSAGSPGDRCPRQFPVARRAGGWWRPAGRARGPCLRPAVQSKAEALPVARRSSSCCCCCFGGQKGRAGLEKRGPCPLLGAGQSPTCRARPPRQANRVEAPEVGHRTKPGSLPDRACGVWSAQFLSGLARHRRLLRARGPFRLQKKGTTHFSESARCTDIPYCSRLPGGGEWQPSFANCWLVAASRGRRSQRSAAGGGGG